MNGTLDPDADRDRITGNGRVASGHSHREVACAVARVGPIKAEHWALYLARERPESDGRRQGKGISIATQYDIQTLFKDVL